MLTKLCAKCGTVIPFGNRYCAACMQRASENAKAYDKTIRDKRSAKFYKSADWFRVRTYCLQRDGYCCVECRKNGMIEAATEVHHIIPLKEDWSKRRDTTNLVSLCHKHHMEIEKKLAGDRKKF